MHALHRPCPAGSRAPRQAAAASRSSGPSRRPAALVTPRAAANPPDAPPAKSSGGGGGGSTWLASIIQKFGPTTEAPLAGAITVLDFEKPLVELDNRIREVCVGRERERERGGCRALTHRSLRGGGAGEARARALQRNWGGLGGRGRALARGLSPRMCARPCPRPAALSTPETHG